MKPPCVRVASRYLQATMRRDACIVAAGKFGDSFALFKNRDRNYSPNLKLVHEVRDGVEVAYIKDDKTGWIEGMNEHGIGIVNAALMVSRDESERDEVERTGKKLLDGDRILRALLERTVPAAAKNIRTYKGGLKGHTIVSDGKKTVYVEMPDSNDVEYDEVSPTKMFVRTNHGVDFPDAGYVEGPREKSSKSRQEEAEEVLAKVKSPDEIAPAILRARTDRWEPTEMVRDSKSDRKMRTTSQMVLDLTSKTLHLYLFPDRVKYLGLDDRLPKDFEPKITVKVHEYTNLKEDTDAETKPVTKKKAALKEPLIYIVQGELSDGLKRVSEWGLSPKMYYTAEGGDGPQVHLRPPGELPPGFLDAHAEHVFVRDGDIVPYLDYRERKLLPVNEAGYNVREIVKQLVMLEDHLFNPRKRCPDCICKHFLTAEALAEEALSLDGAEALHKELDGLAESIRAVYRRVMAEGPSVGLAQQVRGVRKTLMGAASRAKVASDPCSPSAISYAWVDPHGKVHETPHGHEAWAHTFIQGVPSLRDAYALHVQKWSGPPASGVLMQEGWIRVSNFLGIQVWDEKTPTRQAWQALLEVFSRCVLKARGIDPFEEIVYVEELKSGHAEIYTLGDFVERFGSKRESEAMFERLMSRTAGTSASRVASRWLATAGNHDDVASLVHSLRGASSILEQARLRWDDDAPVYLAWVEEVVRPLAEAVADVDEAFTGKRMLRRLAEDVEHAREVLEEGRHWEVYLSDGGYSRLVLHGPAERGPVMHFDPGLAGPKAKIVWNALVSEGHATVGGHIRVASSDKPRFKEKKQVPKADGSGDKTTVYVYSERQVQNRNREKAERLDKLRHSVDDLRAQVTKDLDHKEPKTRLTALAVGLILETFERVGNPGSADDGHFGVTGWLKSHVEFSKGTATITYTGKSGVDHVKTVSDKKLVKALKGCCEDKKPDDSILSFGKDDEAGTVKVTSRDVNAYLKPHDITAKDLRGLGANQSMHDELRAVRKKGPKLPADKKEREKILKAEFKEALEATAELVGHESATLRSQYIVPGTEDQYLKDGTVTDSMKKKGSVLLGSELDATWFAPEGHTLTPESTTLADLPYWEDTCPVCAYHGDMISGCRCHLSDRSCPNGHEWLVCPVHGRHVVIPEGVRTHAYSLARGACLCFFENEGAP